MSAAALTLVLLSGFVHAIWNVFAKRSGHKAVFLWWCQWAAIAVFLPFALRELSTLQPVSPTGWLLAAASVALHGVYVLLLAKTYTAGDLSQAYPIMRGTSPLLVPLLGVLLLQERLPWTGWCGVALIVGGIALTGDWRALFLGRRSAANRTLPLALAVGVMIAGYTVVDKIALAHLPAITLNSFSNVGNLLALSTIALRSGAMAKEWRLHWRTIVLGGLLAPGGYVLFLKALELAPVSHLAPMREIGTVFGALLGIFWLKESRGASRIAASAFITAGIVLLAW